MAKTPVTEILAAIEAVREVKDVVAKHDQAIEKLITRIEQIEARVKALEGGTAGKAP